MIKFIIYPNLKVDPATKTNPYIKDFINALNARDDAMVINPPHKNPLLSLLPVNKWGDVFIFNWFESIPDIKYGPLQTIIAFCFICILKLFNKKIIWVFHNKKPHVTKYAKTKAFLAAFMARCASLIITHATEGVEIIREQYSFASHKVHFLHHPTKDRLPDAIIPNHSIIYDIVIWGSISKYKGVLEFVSFLKQNTITNLKICIIGNCSSVSLAKELQQNLSPNITIISHSPSFEELKKYIAQSHFVLNPYCPDSILSSGTLMDSLSFGAKIIGPHVGSFKDYANDLRLNVYTFQDFKDIESIITKHKEEQISLDGYRQFLTENNWTHFGDKLMKLLI